MLFIMKLSNGAPSKVLFGVKIVNRLADDEDFVLATLPRSEIAECIQL